MNYGRKCSDKFLVQEFEAHNYLSFPGNYGFQMIFLFFFFNSLHIKLSSPWCNLAGVSLLVSSCRVCYFWQRCKWNSGEHLMVTRVDWSTCTGNYPKGHFFRSFSPNNSYRNWPTHRNIPFTLFILHTLRAELQLVSASGRQPLASENLLHECHFPPLSYISVLEKKGTTGPRVLILILVFIFILFEKKETS